MRDINNKPSTLVFEEIFLRSAKAQFKPELELKKEVAHLINKIPHSEHHRQLIQSGVKHILTLNYDYNLEDSSTFKRVDSSLRKEKKYSLFRRNSVGDVHVWHIHGEASAPNTLALGHDHYSGSLHHIREYLVIEKMHKKSPFRQGISDFDKGNMLYSWLDIFLRDDIHFYGCSMEYSEIELWWLLSYKERLRLKRESVGNTHYYYFEDDKPQTRNQAKVAILESFGVRTKKLEGANHLEGFDHFIKLISVP